MRRSTGENETSSCWMRVSHPWAGNNQEDEDIDI